MNEITKIASCLISLRKEMLYLIKEEIDYIIDNNVKDKIKIENIFDRLLDCCFDEENILYYNKLCTYYGLIDEDGEKYYRKQLKINNK